MRKCSVFGENRQCSCGKGCVEVAAERKTGRTSGLGFIPCVTGPDATWRRGGVPGTALLRGKDNWVGGKRNFCNQT